MATINLTADPTDDREFVDLVSQIIAGAVITHRPAEVRIFKIDHWFDHKWLEFSGKTLGAVGHWHNPLTLPPFVANRIVNQWHYERDETCGTYRLMGSGSNIHYRGRAEENRRRFVTRIAPNSALFWFSGNTEETGRGSLMGYIPIDEDLWPWFLAFVREDGWRIARRKSIHEYEVCSFQAAGERLLGVPTPRGTTGDT